MKATIHQANYFPYAGFFHKLSLADVLVLMDDVQYDTKFTNRNKIIEANGWIWLTVPIDKSQKHYPNMEVRINNDHNWKKNHWDKIWFTYTNAPHFHLYQDYFSNLYQNDWEFLFELNFETLKKTINWLDIKIEIIRESELKVQGNATERLVNVCKSIGADTYVSGIGGQNYINENMFKKNSIRLEYQNYSCPIYSQHQAKSFIPDLSIIDLLANVGPQSLDLITGKKDLNKNE